MRYIVRMVVCALTFSALSNVLGAQETRGYGLHEMLEAVREKRPHRASGELGLHVLETATAVLRSAEEGRTIDVVSRFTST